MKISTKTVNKWQSIRSRFTKEEYYWRQWLLPLLNEIIERRFLRLYGLYPFTSLAILKLSRTTIFPYSVRYCPHVLPIGDGIYRVFGTKYRMVYQAHSKSTGEEFDWRHPEYEVLGEACVEETMRLLAEVLPHDIGPAVDMNSDELHRLEGIGLVHAVDQRAEKAIIQGDVEALRDCLQEGATINATNEYGYTPLMRAILHGHTEMVQLLLEHGADIYQENEGEENALAIAQYEGKRYPEILAMVDQMRENKGILSTYKADIR